MTTSPTPDEIAKNKARDRFSGYQLPLEKLDESGEAYVVMRPTPNTFRAMPQNWTSTGTFPSEPAPRSQ